MGNYAAKGTLLKLGDGASPEAFTTIAQVSDINGPEAELEEIDVTHHSSTDGWREKIGGLLNGGDVTLEINYDPAAGTHDDLTGLIKDMTDRTVRNFELSFPVTPALKYGFAALIKNFAPKAPVDGKLSASVTLAVTGAVDFSKA